MKDSVISFDIKGIKCDNKACGWSDMDALFDPDYWLNRPCPDCGSNLFTQKDYDAMMKMFRIAKVINIIFKPWSLLTKNKKKVAVQINMDGSGIPKVDKPVEL